MTVSTSSFVLGGTVPACMSGSSPAPSHVYFCGSRDPSMNAAVESRISAASSGALVAIAPSSPSSPQPATASAAVASSQGANRMPRSLAARGRGAKTARTTPRTVGTGPDPRGAPRETETPRRRPAPTAARC